VLIDISPLATLGAKVRYTLLLRLFKESIPIAQALNRTLIVPPFHHHPRMHLRNESELDSYLLLLFLLRLVLLLLL